MRLILGGEKTKQSKTKQKLSKQKKKLCFFFVPGKPFLLLRRLSQGDPKSDNPQTNPEVDQRGIQSDSISMILGQVECKSVARI